MSLHIFAPRCTATHKHDLSFSLYRLKHIPFYMHTVVVIANYASVLILEGKGTYEALAHARWH